MSERDGQKLGPEQVTALFEDLSARLASEGQSAHLFVVGGAAMALQYDATRVTRDVDALLRPVAAVRRIAADIGASRGLECDWLNAAAKGFLPGNEAHPQTVFQSDSLRVDIPSTQYLLAMKLHAGRDDRDLDDAATLFNAAGMTTGDQGRKLLEQRYAAARLLPRHPYIPDEVAARAAVQRKGRAAVTRAKISDRIEREAPKRGRAAPDEADGPRGRSPRTR